MQWKKSKMEYRTSSRSWSSASCLDNGGRLGWSRGAAQAECLRKVRDEKTYLKFATNWAEFCQRQLKISKRTEHAIQRDGIHVGSDEIALIPENAGRVG
jgi:hypothetical protein